MASGEDRLRVGFIALGMAGGGMVRNLTEYPDVSIAAAAADDIVRSARGICPGL